MLIYLKRAPSYLLENRLLKVTFYQKFHKKEISMPKLVGRNSPNYRDLNIRVPWPLNT